MASIFPSASALSATFGHSTPFKSQPSPYQARTDRFSSWDVAEDAKNKATQLSDAATKEIQKASDIAQAKTGKIELYSGKYYAVSGPTVTATEGDGNRLMCA